MLVENGEKNADNDTVAVMATLAFFVNTEYTGSYVAVVSLWFVSCSVTDESVWSTVRAMTKKELSAASSFSHGEFAAMKDFEKKKNKSTFDSGFYINDNNPKRWDQKQKYNSKIYR